MNVNENKTSIREERNTLYALHSTLYATRYTLHATRSTFYESGQAVIIAVLFFVAGSFFVISGVAAPVLAEIRNVDELLRSKQSFTTAEAAMEDAVYRLKYNLDLSSPEVTVLGESTGTVTNVVSFDTRDVTSVGDLDGLIRKLGASIVEGIGVAFFYGVQAGDGGITMENTSSVLGNAYSNGSITGFSKNVVDGDAISTGANGSVSEVHASGSVWSHDINLSDIDEDAYYQIIDAQTTVLGTKFPDSDDQPSGSLPIKDEWAESWKESAEEGGVIALTDPECSGGTYTIQSDTVLGPVKIECDLVVTGVDLTLAGNIWVEGTILFRNFPTITTDVALGPKSVIVVADKCPDATCPANPEYRESGSTIEIRNSFFVEHSFEGSHVLLLSMNDSAENGGSTVAITVQNSAEGDFLVYAGHGEILLKNNASLSEVSAYKILLQNKAQVIYETGLQNLLFDAGPSGGYIIEAWGEI